MKTYAFSSILPEEESSKKETHGLHPPNPAKSDETEVEDPLIGETRI